MNIFGRSSWRASSRGTFASLAAVVAVASCGGSSFQGTPVTSDIGCGYTATVTSGNNGCQFSNWTMGSTTQDVHLNVQQTGGTATATVTGVAGLVFDVILGGTPTFQGTVSGDTFDLVAVGTNSSNDGQCSYTIK